MLTMVPATPIPQLTQFGDDVFSISLAVKDSAVSRAFFETFGFTVGGDAATNGLILKRSDHGVGLV